VGGERLTKPHQPHSGPAAVHDKKRWFLATSRAPEVDSSMDEVTRKKIGRKTGAAAAKGRFKKRSDDSNVANV